MLARYPLQIPIEARWKSLEGKWCRSCGVTRDMSVKGVFIVAEICPPVGEVVRIHGILRGYGSQGEVWLRGTGQVQRIENLGPSGFGFAVVAVTRFRVGRRVDPVVPQTATCTSVS